MPIVKIVPPNTGPNQALAQGTKVLVDGVELDGVQKIVLTAEVNELWRAEIHCLASFDTIQAEGKITTKKPSLWARLKRRFLREEIEVTTLESSSREYR